MVVEDCRRGFKHLTELLEGRFRQQEEQRETLDEVYAYVKVYMPQQIQTQINESVTYLIRDCLKATQKSIDKEKYLAYQSSRYEHLMKNLDALKHKLLGTN